MADKVAQADISARDLARRILDDEGARFADPGIYPVLASLVTGQPVPAGERLSSLRDEVMSAIEPVHHWYQSDEAPERPIGEILADIVADLESNRAEILEIQRNEAIRTVASARRELSDETLSPAVAAYVRGLEATVRSQARENAALEALRPIWAQGYTRDSVAAQTASAALSSLWGLLGADNQTQAMMNLREVLGVEPHDARIDGAPQPRALPETLPLAQASYEDAMDALKRMTAIVAEGTSASEKGYGPPYRAPWFIVDTSTADLDVNYPGEIIERIDTVTEVRDRLAHWQATALVSALSDRARESRIRDAAYLLLNDNAALAEIAKSIVFCPNANPFAVARRGLHYAADPEGRLVPQRLVDLHRDTENANVREEPSHGR